MLLSMNLWEYPLDKSISLSFSISQRNLDTSETKPSPNLCSNGMTLEK